MKKEAKEKPVKSQTEVKEEKVDFSAIEKKWQEAWEKEGIFQPDIDDKKKKFFLTTPYPYISGSLHLGHGRAATESDIYSRYKRMKGFNVMFPMAFHISGTPVLGISAAIKNGDKNKIKLYEDYVAAYEKDPQKIKTIIKSFEDPQKIVDFFIPKMIKEYKQLGLSVDWRRSFTSGDFEHQKMVGWQFNKYQENGFLIKGNYPVLFCPSCGNAVGEDDIQDADSDPVAKQDFIWGKFRMKNSDLIVMAGTTRPDAFYGQTHIWIDPEGDYVVVDVKGEKWVVGKKVVDKIKNQYETDIKIIRDISPKELIGKMYRGPIVDYDVTALPAWFIDSSVGSGIVYSALEDPFDYFELKKIQDDEKLQEKYKLDKEVVKKLKPIYIITVSGMGENLGDDIGKEFGVKSSKDVEALEKAKAELNKRVFRKGIMRENCGQCKGMTIPQCQEFLKKSLTEKRDAVMFYESSREAFCRCGEKIVVSVLKNQWFIDFNAKGWKEKAYDCLKKIELLPETNRKLFEDVFAWLDKRPCARKRGLGTELPFEKGWMIESLSDSTIYMTLYTISHLIKKYKLTEKNLTQDFFDYVYLEKGKLEDVSKKIGVKSSVLEEFRKNFEYWMPNDQRHTFILHLSNHLSFMIFAFAGLFKEKYWPKKISFHGLIISGGEKMSKSKGNVITILHVKKNYGADVFRFYLTQSTNVQGTFDWRETEAQNAKKAIEKLYFEISEAIKLRKKGEVKPLYAHKFNKILKNASAKIEEMKLREYNNLAVYDMLGLVREAKTNLNEKELAAFYDYILSNWLKILSPTCPHITEELWSKMGNKTFLSLESWPKADESKIDEKLEEAEKNVEKTVADILNVLNIIKQKTGKEGNKVYLYVMPFELASYNAEAISKRTLKEVKVFAVNDKAKYDPEGKASKAKPAKPAIFIE